MGLVNLLVVQSCHTTQSQDTCDSQTNYVVQQNFLDQKAPFVAVNSSNSVLNTPHCKQKLKTVSTQSFKGSLGLMRNFNFMGKLGFMRYIPNFEILSHVHLKARVQQTALACSVMFMSSVAASAFAQNSAEIEQNSNSQMVNELDVSEKEKSLLRAQAISDFEHHDSEEVALETTGKDKLNDFMSNNDFGQVADSEAQHANDSLEKSYYYKINKHYGKVGPVNDGDYPVLSFSLVKRQSEDELIFGYSAMQFSNPWYKDVIRGMGVACRELNIKCVALDAKNSLQNQIDDIKGMIEQKYDAIFTTSLDSSALGDLYKQAQQAGIITGSLGYLIENSNLEYIVLEYDYGYAIGSQAAHWTADQLKCKAKAIVLSQDNIEESVTRGDGVIDALHEACPELNIVARFLASNPDQAYAVTDATLKQHPDLNLVVASTDAAGIGAYRAMLEHKATDAKRGVFSGDATVEVLSLLKDPDNIYRGTVKLSPIRSGYESIFMLKELVEIQDTSYKIREFMPFSAINKEDYRSTLWFLDNHK